MSGFAERLAAAAAAAVLACLALAPSASAGTYDVYACNTPAGRFANHSWTLYTTAGDFIARDCNLADANPEFSISSPNGQTYGVYRGAQLTFQAAPQTTIVGFRWNRSLRHFNPTDGAPAGYGAFLSSYAMIGGIPLEGTGANDAAIQGPPTAVGAWDATGGKVDRTGDVSLQDYAMGREYHGDGTILRAGIGCAGNGCSLMTDDTEGPGYISFAIRGATVTLNDPVAPRIDRVTPTVPAAGAMLVGDEPVAFDAADNTGIRRAEVIDVSSGTAQVVGGRDFACDHSYAAPCPLTLSGERIPVNIPSGGQRTLRVRVIDAGDNVAESPAFIEDVGGPLNGSGATPVARLSASFSRKRSRVDVAYGRSARISGRLTDATGKPITGATIQILDRELRSGTQYGPRLEVTTDADGRFSVVPGPGAARAIRFEFRSRRLLPAADAADSVELRVAAAATLSITPRRVRPRGTIRISGRLKGLPLPRSGKLVELQAFEAGKWRAVGTVRARGAKGRFSTTYRFLRAGRGASFLIRARIRRDDSYPFYLGYSPRVRVRVR
ncbi:carboxypeptidase-like regulatory domain-containing protein [Solirubrobacter ginsenosidimutans]|uniref:Carboxypeptidase-like regulatory domain-containing protein n=1 Tax=Solirubrobacter ginsenosidimutans TaxID=490573 RepID=A0A9X3S2U3_9ACTN|nr:carboxypeptidase-like regulatory domain-containing protein [Solirubrobacter ginsenosidimutans]MDA0162662.1 carboxypeptidase-like regulatory domain-containing protein [Solirubrobacter ginsenosidimutans]